MPFILLLPEAAPALAAAGLNLIVALGLIMTSLMLGVAVSLMIGLPAVVTAPQRAIRAQLNRRNSE